MMEGSRQKNWNPQSAIPLSTQTAESAAAEAPAALVALSTAWCHTQRWSDGYEHTLMKLPDQYVVLVMSQRGVSGGSPSIGQPMKQEKNKGYHPLLLSHSVTFFFNSTSVAERSKSDTLVKKVDDK